MNLMTYEEFKNSNYYNAFIKENPSIGNLKVEVFTAYKGLPIPNAEILITKDFGNDRVLFFRGVTNSSGMIDDIKLPAPYPEAIASYENTPKYTIYDLTAINPEYETIKKYNVGIFGEVKIIQYVKMIPKVELEGEVNG